MTVSDVVGSVLTGIFTVVSRIRPTVKPLHPDGDLLGGSIRRDGLQPGVGVPWIDEPGTDRVLVRMSRAVGLPSGWPDIFGLAIRVSTSSGAHGDVLLATTGRTPVSRFVLIPHRAPTAGTYTTLIPYRTTSGALVLAAQPDGDRAFALACARPAGPWRPFGRLELDAEPADDLGDASEFGPAFDPVINQLPGLSYYAWASKIREGSYRAARRSRGQSKA